MKISTFTKTIIFFALGCLLSTSTTAQLEHGRIFVGTVMDTDNSWTRGILSTNIKWEGNLNRWQIGGSPYSDMAMLRFTNGGNISFFTRASTGNSYSLTNSQMNSYNRMTIKNNGYVGIGLSNPTFKLDVNGTTRTTRIRLGDKWILSANGSIFNGSAYDDSWLRLNNTSNNDYHGGFAAGMLWCKQGFVQSISGDHAYLRLITNSNSNQIASGIDFKHGTNNQNFLLSNFGDRLAFVRWENNSEVGSVFEVYRDHVWAKEICVSANGNVCPDYVFEEDYELKSLNELESYINENKHLPGVKSASEVEKEGINITEMTFSLLEKVEELTLYTLEQQKEIEALKSKLEETGQD